MKKISNKLFQDLILENSAIVTIIGGAGTTTNVGSDTNMSNGAGYDIAFDTLDSKGGNTGIDTDFTGATEKDKPGPCKLVTSIF
jgi:hypothetical protein